MKYLDDLLILSGCAMITTGAYIISPVSALFVAGSFCIILGVLVGLGWRRQG